jgi:hypothetical protein
MNQHINPAKAGLALGKLFGGLHLVWAILIALGWAQGLVNFSMWAHMVNVPVVVQAFNFSAAATVVIVASLIGYVVGYVFAKIWNWLHRG